MSSEQMQSAIKELQETMVVMAHIEKTQSEHIRDLVQFRVQSWLGLRFGVAGTV